MRSNSTNYPIRSPLPIDRHIDEIQTAIDHFSASILIAPTGAGKSTHLPALLKSPGRIVIVQPRRAAARLVAHRIADNTGEKLGDGVGYHIRFDKTFQKSTKIVVLTEGMLLRWLQADPFLDGVSLVILDEFHERSVSMDLSLALIREIQMDLRDDLKLLIMSATLDPNPLREWLGQDTPIIISKGRTHPVEIVYDIKQNDQTLSLRCQHAIVTELKRCSGDLLVFLPGAREINAVFELTKHLSNIDVVPLHGRLSISDQRKALSADGPRKVILATNIAETSLTLPRVDGVIDAGLQRQSNDGAGFNHLQTKRVSLDAADQRAGRAGRLRPGRCRRLWTQHAQSSMTPHRIPEIKRADLSQTALQLLSWGVNPCRFNWFDPPPKSTIEKAMQCLLRLGARNENGLTALGRKMAELPCSPSIGKLLISAEEKGCLFEAAGLAAILSDGFWGQSPHLMDWLKSLQKDQRGRRCRQIRQQFLTRFQPTKQDVSDEDTLGKAIIDAFPDRVGQKRNNKNSYLMADGSEAFPQKETHFGEWIVAPALGQVDKGQRRIRGAIEIDPKWLKAAITKKHFMKDGKVICEERRQWGALTLTARQVATNPEIASDILFAASIKAPNKALKVSKAALALKARIEWVSTKNKEVEWPNLINWRDFLVDACIGRRSYEELNQIKLEHALFQSLSWDQKKQLEQHAPSHFKLPTGYLAPIQYTQGSPPKIEARIQQVFGLTTTPKLGGEPIQIALLAPNNRPQQLTIDLNSFWKEAYPLIRKELRGRYPKHAWPEKPTKEDAEDRPKRRHLGSGKKTK